MELIICNTNFERIGQINDASSKIWHRKFYEPGDFEIYLPADKENKELLQENYYVVRDDSEEVGIIEDIEIIYDVNDEVDMMIVKGRFTESIYSRRIIWQQSTIDTTLENGLRNLIIDNIINPKNINMSLTKGSSSAIASISDSSTGITGAKVNKTVFENRSSLSVDVSDSIGIIDADVNKTTFESQIKKSDTYKFTYDGSDWSLNGEIILLSTYGITYNGNPLIGDTIIIIYSSNLLTGEHNFSYKNNASSLKINKAETSGLTRAIVTKEIFEKKITATGSYQFKYGSNNSLISSNIGESKGITAVNVVKATFETKISLTNIYTFKFSDDVWELNDNTINLKDYGITITGTPQRGDEIIIYYSKHTWRINNGDRNIAEYGVEYAGTPKADDIILLAYTSAITDWFFNGDVINLSDYGITYTGTATTGDTIIINYNKTTGITSATIDKLRFQKRAVKSGTYIFKYSGTAWSLDGIDVNLSSYGITYEGTPVNSNVITVILSDMSNRIIREIQLGELKGYQEKLSAQYTGDNLGTIITESCQPNGIGYRNKFRNNMFYFELYKGIDRSYNQILNPRVIFSDEYDNLVSSGYVKTNSNYKNTALVAGEGEGLARTTKEINGDNSGLNRRELYVDARSISSNNEEISDNDYDSLLIEKGTEDLSTYLITEVFTGDVVLTDRYKYKEEVDLGDICSIENKKWGVYSNSRIIGVIETDDENGEQIVFEFGS